MRLAVVVSHPTQYYGPWFRWLAQRTPLAVRVFYLWDFGVTPTRDPQFERAFAWDVDLLSGYDHELVRNVSRTPGTESFFGLRNPELPARLASYGPDAILLFGYRYASHLRVLRWARRRRVPVILRGDSHLLVRGRPPRWKRAVLREVVRRCAAFAYVGTANREYFRALGVPGRRLFFAPHAVDRSSFDPGLPGPRRTAADLRRSLGLEGRRVVLFAGKLVARKQPRALLDAFVALDRGDAALVFVGDGAERPALEAVAAGSPRACVRFLDFANQSEMPSRYLLGDVFVLPSIGPAETWGLAVNEAMHMGLPCLVSDHVGCQRDLVEDGVTGWVFRAADAQHLRARLADALDATPEERERLAAGALARIARYTYAETTAGLLRALDAVA